MNRMRRKQRKRLRADVKAAIDADETEFAAIIHGSTSFEAGIADDRTAGIVDELGVPAPLAVAPWAETDMQYDDAAGSIAEEILRRRLSMGDAYPFTVDSNGLTYRQSVTLVYEFCLAVCMVPSVSTKPFDRLLPAFERLSRDVLKCFLGPGAEGYRTGWPRDGKDDRPIRFKAVVERLHELTGEWFWSPAAGNPDDPSHTVVKDEGLDVVVWKQLGDGRPGQLFMLGQCACGQDWTNKLHEVNIDRLQSKWVRPLSAARPVRVFATSHHITNAQYFAEVNFNAGLTLDRSRLTIVAEREENRAVVLAGAVEPFAELIGLVIPDFEVGQQVA